MPYYFEGPYRVLEHISGHRYKLQHIHENRLREEHLDHLKILKYPDSEPAQTSDLAEPLSQPSTSHSSQSNDSTMTRDLSQSPTSLSQSSQYDLRPRWN